MNTLFRKLLPVGAALGVLAPSVAVAAPIAAQTVTDVTSTITNNVPAAVTIAVGITAAAYVLRLITMSRKV